eukprot:GHRQ01018532.1.p1 GENE.GHRQ01018532.1~~GHRQ01018532.1.p1  ORF type:complete len:188 (+),score=18.19 GHRQ01018532.1:1119-1682(+)
MRQADPVWCPFDHTGVQTSKTDSSTYDSSYFLLSLAPTAQQDVSSWLSPADLRRARLVCKSWLGALATLSTKATTPPESRSVTEWRAQLETMVLALPCLQELTIGSKLSSVGAQQLGVLSGAHQLRCLHIPYGHALQDRSMQVTWVWWQQHSSSCRAVMYFCRYRVAAGMNTYSSRTQPACISKYIV